MRMIVCGGANYRLTPADYARLDALHEGVEITAVVSGGGPGAELGGEVWAATRGVAIRRMPVGDHRMARLHPLKSEVELSAVADAVVLFPGNRDLDEMARAARTHGLEVHDWRKDAERQAIENDVTYRFVNRAFFHRGPSCGSINPAEQDHPVHTETRTWSRALNTIPPEAK